MRVLVVDDERNMRTTLAVCLGGLGHEVTRAATSQAAVNAALQRPFDLAFVDLRLDDESGLDLAPRLLAEMPGLLIVLITAFATVETAVEAMKRGAWEYLPKPFTASQIAHLCAKAAERRALEGRIQDLESRVERPESDLVCESPAMRAVLATVARAAQADAPVLFRGESGTGKSVLARVLHAQSARRDRPFVVTNCPTLSEELLAGELFGHARDAFAGAERDQPGRVEAAEGGTLFLDEIGEIPTPLQAKLLRFLQDKDFERLGETRTRHADVRVVAATNRDLDAAVRGGSFREDLLYRLNVVEIAVPALRDRPEDILPMARRFLASLAPGKRRVAPELSPAAEKALVAYDWPGNVRELHNAIERALILWPASIIEPAAFPGRLGMPGPVVPQVGGDFTLDALEREHILRVLARVDRMDEAAGVLGIDASTLWRKRRKYDEGG